MAASTVTLSSVVNTIATSNKQDSAAVAKRVRSYIRGHFDDLSGDWKSLADAKDNRDGNRYPPMPKGVADALIGRFTK